MHLYVWHRRNMECFWMTRVRLALRFQWRSDTRKQIYFERIDELVFNIYPRQQYLLIDLIRNRAQNRVNCCRTTGCQVTPWETLFHEPCPWNCEPVSLQISGQTIRPNIYKRSMGSWFPGNTSISLFLRHNMEFCHGMQINTQKSAYLFIYKYIFYLY